MVIINYAAICIFCACKFGVHFGEVVQTSPKCVCVPVCLPACLCVRVRACVRACVRVLNKKGRHLEAAPVSIIHRWGLKQRAECFGSPHTCYRPNNKAVNQYFSPLKPGQPSGDWRPIDPKKLCSMFQKIETDKTYRQTYNDMQTARKADRQYWKAGTPTDRQADSKTGKTDRQAGKTAAQIQTQWKSLIQMSGRLEFSFPLRLNGSCMHTHMQIFMHAHTHRDKQAHTETRSKMYKTHAHFGVHQHNVLWPDSLSTYVNVRSVFIPRQEPMTVQMACAEPSRLVVSIAHTT